jgi:hypothetical protein
MESAFLSAARAVGGNMASIAASPNLKAFMNTSRVKFFQLTAATPIFQSGLALLTSFPWIRSRFLD